MKVCVCACVCACLLLYNHVYGCACTDVGEASMSVLESTLCLHLQEGVCARTYMCRAQLKNPFQKAVSVALVFTMSL